MSKAREFWIHEALIGPKTGQRYPASVEKSSVEGYIHVREVLDHDETPMHKLLSNQKWHYEGEIARLQKEVDDQCRVNGMGAQRELKLMTEVKRLREAIEIAIQMLSRGTEDRAMFWTENTIDHIKSITGEEKSDDAILEEQKK